MNTIQQQLRDVRRTQHISQKALGSRMGLPQSHLSAIETGKVDPRLSSIIEIARLLDYEPLLVPRTLLPTVRAMLEGQAEAPLWQVDDNDKDAT